MSLFDVPQNKKIHIQTEVKKKTKQKHKNIPKHYCWCSKTEQNMWYAS